MNTSLFFNGKVAHDAIFRAEQYVDTMCNDSKELVGWRQQGGVLLFILNDLAKHSSLTGKEETGLGLWFYHEIFISQKKEGIICACQCAKCIEVYNIVCSKKRRYFSKTNWNICPRRSFREDFVSFIEQTKANGFSLVISLDSNEHAISENLASSFSRFIFIDSITEMTSKIPPYLHMNGSNLTHAT